MRPSILPTLALITLLPACDLLDDTDWREGVEGAEACMQRLDGWEEQAAIAAAANLLYVPTYTYDITKLDLDAIQALVTDGSDETAGARRMARTNETGTARSQFEGQPVDEDGAFFMGADPALYRVRGAAQRLEAITAAGCERQQANMRLIDIEAAAMQTGSPVDPSDSETAD